MFRKAEESGGKMREVEKKVVVTRDTSEGGREGGVAR